MKYKLLALDIDGTLLTDDHQISPLTEEWISRAVDAGIHVCLSTGRRYEDAITFGRQLGLRTPMVTVNGSEIWKSPDELYRRQLIDTAMIAKMYDLSQHHGVWFWAYAVEGSYNERNWDSSLLEVNHWMKFGYYTEDDHLRERIWTELHEQGNFEITNSSEHNIEINPKGVNKQSGIATVCQLLHIQMSEVVAVGDSLNDLAVIQAAGLGVAMGNAQPIVKEKADIITASNNENGIALMIRDYILGSEEGAGR